MVITDSEIRNIVATHFSRNGDGAIAEAIGGLLDRIQELQRRIESREPCD